MNKYIIDVTIFEGTNNPVDYKTLTIYADSKHEAVMMADVECRRRDNWVKVTSVRTVSEKKRENE